MYFGILFLKFLNKIVINYSLEKSNHKKINFSMERRKSNSIFKSCVSKMILVALVLVLGVDWQSVRSQGTVIGSNDDEDDSWYEVYLDLVVDWEEAEIRDPRLPFPSDKQVEMRTQARKDNLTTLVIEDLTEYEQLFYDYASTDGIKMLELLSNISLSM